MFAVVGKPYRGQPTDGRVLSHVNDRSVSCSSMLKSAGPNALAGADEVRWKMIP